MNQHLKVNLKQRSEKRVSEAVACPGCASSRAHPLFAERASVFGIYRCLCCDLQYTFPVPAADDWCDWYGGDYRPFQPLAKGKQYRRRRRDSRKYPKPMGNRRLLEIGCGVGEYLGTMQSLGWDVVGLEPSPYAIESAEPSLQPKIIHEKFPTDLPMGGPFSLVVAWQVLEHLADPRQCLLAVRELLATDGLLMLAVPNADSWSARLFGGDWIGWDVPRHLVHFTKKTLKALLHRTGFDILHMGSEPRSSWVRHSTRQCSGWKRRLLKSSAGSRLFAYSSWIVGQADSLFVMARPR